MAARVSEQQKRFVDLLLADPERNAKQAAIDAGYSKKTAGSQASQMLGNPRIQALIEEKDRERMKRTQIDQDYVLHNLQEAVEMGMGIRPITVTINKNGKKQVDKVRKTNLTAANKSLEMLGRHLGMFVDKQEIEDKRSLEVTMQSISKENAAQRKSLLPKDNIEFDDSED